MASTSETLKKYIGYAGEALAYVFLKDRETQDKTAATPPVGAKSEYKPEAIQALGIGGISTGTLLLLGVLWYLFKR